MTDRPTTTTEAQQVQQALEHEPQLTTMHHHGGLSHIVDELDERDAEERYREEAADNNTTGGHIHLTDSKQPHHYHQQPRQEQDEEQQQNSHGGSQHAESLSNSENDTIIVAWEENDPENPYNWSNTRKIGILITTMLAILNSTMGSALPSNAIPFMAKEWGVTSSTQEVLPMSMFLVGYVFGPLVWAPLSEQFGRRLLTTVTVAIFMVWTMACALAPNWPAFLVFRLFTGIFASAPIAIVTGILADVFGSARTRGRAMSMFMAATVFGPLFAPIISGFCSASIGWRWTFWIGLIYGGASFVPLVFFLPETYGPVLLMWRAARLRRERQKAIDEGGGATPAGAAAAAAAAAKNIVAPHELEKKTLRELAVVVLTRPVRMIMFELIVSCVCIYLALLYAVFYMTFQAFPLIFEGIYGFSPGVDGLIFLTIGAGAALSIPVFYAYDNYMLAAVERGEPWTRKEEYRRLPLACLGGPCFAISLFWLGWTSKAGISFVSPMLAGVPFGLGFVLIFIALLNYVTDAYEVFAASANAATSCCRSLLATVLPLATTPMFTRLTISGACSLLGGFALLMCAIPFIFIWKGERIRAGSRFCIALRERKLEMQRKAEEQRQRQQQQQLQHSEKSLQQAPPSDKDGETLPPLVHDLQKETV